MTEIGISTIPEAPLVRQHRKHRELIERLGTLELLLRSLGAVTPAEVKAKP